MSSSIFFLDKNKPTSTQTYTSGSGSWVVPDHVYQVWVELVGGGGSGARSQSGTTALWKYTAFGGEAGQAILTMVPVTPGASISYSVGSGGAAATTASVGNPGSNSTFGSLRAGGGAGGGWVRSENGPMETAERGRGIGRNGFRANGGSLDFVPSAIEQSALEAFGGDGCYGAGGAGSTSGAASAGGTGAGGGGGCGVNSGAGGAGRIQLWWVPQP